MNYERLVQWFTGPLSAGIGIGTTAIVHGSVSKSSSVAVATFILSSLATAAGHVKWLNNVAKWWEHSQLATPAEPAGHPPSTWDESPALGTLDAGEDQDAAERLRAQLTAAGIEPKA